MSVEQPNGQAPVGSGLPAGDSDDRPTAVIGLGASGSGPVSGSVTMPAAGQTGQPAPYPAPGPAALESVALESAAAVLPPAERETVTCPECGATQDVHLNRRDSADFCHSCDFPLFWTPSRVLRERDSRLHGETLRRLPGTVGKSTLASAACPHCAELNTVTAQTCVRCGLPMHPVEPPPPPAPVYVPPPPPPVVEEPEPGVPWWVWALIGFAFVATVVIIILILTDVIG